MCHWLRGMGIAAGIGLALLIAPFVDGVPEAAAGRSPSGLRVVSVSVDSLVDVALNEVVQIRFDRRMSKSSLTDGSISIRPVVGGVLGEPRPGVLRRRGNVVQFVPTLPTHAVDPDDPNGDFHPSGSPHDDAFENGSFRVGTVYRVVIFGRGGKPAARSASGHILRRTATAEFRTFDATREEPLFFSESPDLPTLRVRFTNPPDGLLSAARGYRNAQGTPWVPTDARVTVFCSGAPFDPVALREPGAVELLRVAPLVGDAAPEVVAGDVLVEQDRNRANLTFRPAEPLQELSTYALRISESVQDLTETVPLQAHSERTRLWNTYRHVSASRALDPGVPVAQLPHPPLELIFDWPRGAAARGVLMANILDAGNNRPWTIDPRVYAVFTTRDEAPVVTVPTDSAGKRAADRRGTLATITRVVTPLGLVGAGSGVRGTSITLPFSLADRRGRSAVVEAQFGVDLDGNGVIDEHEFRPITLDRQNEELAGSVSRRLPLHGRKFFASPGTGNSNSLVWNSYRDLGGAVYRTIDYIHTDHGRNIADPNDPGSLLFDTPTAGVVVRMRTTRGRRRASDWVYSRPLDFSNGTPPSLTIDRIQSGDPVLIDWSAYDRDSEDANGNGVVDFVNGEDRNDDGLPDYAFVTVAFDFFVVADGQEPADLAVEDLAALDWRPCTRDDGAGDPDVGLPASPVGNAHAFAWDRGADGLSDGDRVIVRARAIDDTRIAGAWVYSADVVTIFD